MGGVWGIKIVVIVRATRVIYISSRGVIKLPEACFQQRPNPVLTMAAPALGDPPLSGNLNKVDCCT